MEVFEKYLKVLIHCESYFCIAKHFSCDEKKGQIQDNVIIFLFTHRCLNEFNLCRCSLFGSRSNRSKQLGQMFVCVSVCMSLTAFVNSLTILTVGLLLLLYTWQLFNWFRQSQSEQDWKHACDTVFWSILCDRYAVNHFLLPHNINLNQLVTTKYRANSTFIYILFCCVWLWSLFKIRFASCWE